MSKHIRDVSKDLLLNTCLGHEIGGASHHELAKSLIKHGVLHTRAVIDAFDATDRSVFVPNKHINMAYENRPVPLGFQANISTPQHHAHVMELMAPALRAGNRAVDIGCGTGFLVSMMSRLVGPSGHVVGVDIVPELLKEARENVPQTSVVFKTGSQLTEWLNDEMYDCIHVGIAVPDQEYVDILMNRLTPQGVLVIPVGSGNQEQSLYKVTKDSREKIMSVLCQEMLTQAPVKARTVDQVEAELKQWIQQYEQIHGIKPIRKEILADSEANQLFSEFSELRTRVWPTST